MIKKKTDFDAKLSSLHRKITANKSKKLLVDKELKKWKTFDSSYLIGKSHFEGDGTSATEQISWKSKGLSAETIKPPTRSDNSLNPELSYYGNKTRVKFTGSCLQQPNISYTHGKVVNIYIAYEVGASSSHEDDTTLENCLFCAVTLTKNADIDKYGYLGYDIGFYRKSNFSFPNGGFGQNVINFGVDMGSSAHIHNKKKTFQFLGKVQHKD